MPVSGQELASLDFSNLIGGPLNAVVQAQAKSAITTAEFIKSVGFDKNGSVVNTSFKYNRKNDNGSDQEFDLTVPFIMMLPIPYISISSAVVEFNAKITSTTASTSESTFGTEVKASAGGSWWFAKASLDTKTSYQKKSSNSDKEERTFDMHVRVEAKNVDMPAGTERIMTLLENSIAEKTSHKLSTVALVVKKVDSTGLVLDVDGKDFGAISSTGGGATLAYGGGTFTVASTTPAVAATATTAAVPAKLTLTAATGSTVTKIPDTATDKGIEIKLP
jgi:hypothetical protein